jgi:hypothetical protein
MLPATALYRLDLGCDLKGPRAARLSGHLATWEYREEAYIKTWLTTLTNTFQQHMERRAKPDIALAGNHVQWINSWAAVVF